MSMYSGGGEWGSHGFTLRELRAAKARIATLEAENAILWERIHAIGNENQQFKRDLNNALRLGGELATMLDLCVNTPITGHERASARTFVFSWRDRFSKI